MEQRNTLKNLRKVMKEQEWYYEANYNCYGDGKFSFTIWSVGTTVHVYSSNRFKKQNNAIKDTLNELNKFKKEG